MEVTDSEAEFADRNKAEWPVRDDVSENGMLLADVTLTHPGYVMNAAIAGRYLADELDLGVFFLPQRYERGLYRICDSYGASGIVPVSKRFRKPRLVRRALEAAWRLYDDADNMADIRKLSYEGVHIGDLIYNTYLQKIGAGTAEQLTWGLYITLANTLLYYHYYEYLIEQHDVRAILAAQASYSKCGTLIRIGLKQDLDVFERIYGPQEFTVRRFNGLDEAYTPNRPNENVFEYVWEKRRKQAIGRATDHLDDRLSGNASDVIVSKAYSADNEGKDRAQLVETLDLDPDKPIVVLMSHVFLDAGHFPGSIFSDYVRWLRETLQHVRHQDHANWVVKAHPGADRFECEHTVTDEFVAATHGFDEHNLTLLPDDIGTSAVHDLADVVMTVRGSAGVEFPAMGTPAIVASDCHYTGFEFTHEPTSKQDYFEVLDNISELPELTEYEIARARVMVYFMFVLHRVPCEYIPDTPKNAIDDTDDIWDQAAALLSENEITDEQFRDAVRTFVTDDHQHILRYEEIGLYSSR